MLFIPQVAMSLYKQYNLIKSLRIIYKSSNRYDGAYGEKNRERERERERES